jgi:hypothetical protein
MVLGVSLLQAAVLAPITVLADALALGRRSAAGQRHLGFSMAGCAALARRPSSSARYCLGRR